MLVYTDKTTDLGSGVDPDEVFNRPCNFLADLDRLDAFRKFIYIVWQNKGNSWFPQRHLYNNIFKHIIYTDTNGDPADNFGNTLPPGSLPVFLPVANINRTNIDVGNFAEAATTFALFYMTIKLAKDIGYRPASTVTNFDDYYLVTLQNDNVFTGFNAQLFRPPDNSSINSSITASDSSKSAIYLKLRQVLFDNGFLTQSEMQSRSYTATTVNAAKRDLNELLDPYVFRSGLNNFLQNMGNIMQLDNPTGSSSVRRFDFNKIGISATSATFVALRNTQIDKIYKDYQTVIQSFIRKEVDCIFRAFLPGYETPSKNIMLASGDGTSTVGMFGVSVMSVLLFTYDLQNRQVQGTKSENFTQGAESIIHLNIFGLDFPNPFFSTLTLTNLDNAAEFFTFRANNDNPDLALTSSSTALQIIGNDIIRLAPDPLDNEVIATYDPVLKNLKFLTKETFKFNAKVTSGVNSNLPVNNNMEELQLMMNIVSENKDVIDIDLEDLFPDDKFELTSNQINKLLASQHDINVLKKLIKELQNGTPVTITMNGKFVGVRQSPIRLGTSKVIPDPQYIPSPSSPNPETTTPQLGYNRRRYSFGKIVVIEDFVIKIDIDSFVSPLRSRFDERFNTDDYRNNSIPTAGNPPPPGTPPSESDMRTRFTLYPAYSTSGNIPSYNQALACLRSFGVLECIMYRLYDVGLSMNPQVNLQNMIQNILSDPNVKSIDKTADSRGITSGNPFPQLTNTFSYSDYKSFKWYRLYGLDANGNPGPQTPDNYEYNYYRHNPAF